MVNIFHHVKRHEKTVHCHVKKHHKKYLFGLFGGFAIVKMVIVFTSSVGVFHYGETILADTDCVLTGQYYTGEVQECTTTTEGYYTGGSLDESGNLVGQTYVDPVQNCITTGGYYTGGTLLCPQNDGGTTENVSLLTGNGLCDSGDIQRSYPLAGVAVQGTIPFAWSYLDSDCASGNIQTLNFQLYDHNNQWISLATLSSVATGFSFDSSLLVGYRNASGLLLSGLYTVSDASGVVLFQGIASGTYVGYATGYKVRFVNQNSDVLFVSDTFTIDNIDPTLTGVSLASSDAVSGYVGLRDLVTLSFTASEELTGVTVLVGGTGAEFVSKNGLTYTYSQTLSSGFAEGILSYAINYTDLAGNTGQTSTLGTLFFDKTAPVLSQVVMTGTIASGLVLSFTTSEPSRLALSYSKEGGTITSWTGTTYATGHQYLFSGVEADVLYTFKFSVDDIVQNKLTYSGSFTISTDGAITFVYALYQESVSTGTLLALTNILKEEIAKFNACKSGLVFTAINLTINRNSYMLQMPKFKKSYVKKIVDAFSLLVLDKVEGNKRLTKEEVTEITEKFDNFLIILKFLRDDDNACKQNLSNYHISQFQRAMMEYEIYFK